MQPYKDKKAVKNSSEDILIFQDTHEPIIDRRTWYLVQELRKTVRRVDTSGEGSRLTGKLYCADCGGIHKKYAECIRGQGQRRSEKAENTPCEKREAFRVVSRRIIETNRHGIFTRDMEAIHIFHIPRLFRPVEV